MGAFSEVGVLFSGLFNVGGFLFGFSTSSPEVFLSRVGGGLLGFSTSSFFSSSFLTGVEMDLSLDGLDVLLGIVGLVDFLAVDGLLVTNVSLFPVVTVGLFLGEISESIEFTVFSVGVSSFLGESNALVDIVFPPPPLVEPIIIDLELELFSNVVDLLVCFLSFLVNKLNKDPEVDVLSFCSPIQELMAPLILISFFSLSFFFFSASFLYLSASPLLKFSW